MKWATTVYNKLVTSTEALDAVTQPQTFHTLPSATIQAIEGLKTRVDSISEACLDIMNNDESTKTVSISSHEELKRFTGLVATKTKFAESLLKMIDRQG